MSERNESSVIFVVFVGDVYGARHCYHEKQNSDGSTIGRRMYTFVHEL